MYFTLVASQGYTTAAANVYYMHKTDKKPTIMSLKDFHVCFDIAVMATRCLTVTRSAFYLTTSHCLSIPTHVLTLTNVSVKTKPLGTLFKVTMTLKSIHATNNPRIIPLRPNNKVDTLPAGQAAMASCNPCQFCPTGGISIKWATGKYHNPDTGLHIATTFDMLCKNTQPHHQLLELLKN